MDGASSPDSPRSSILPWLIVGVTLLSIGIATLPPLLVSGRMQSQRPTTRSRLMSIASAETDFRVNDRDGNHVNDYWTGDVKSLYTLTSARVPGAGGGPEDPPLKLIELRLASSDADDRLVPAGGENTDLSRYSVPDFRDGYWFAALERDLRDGSVYRQDTGGGPPMGSCHHLTKFGFVAFPDSQSAGPYVYMVDQQNSIIHRSTIGSVRKNRSVPPGWDGFDPAFRDWPNDSNLRSWWSPSQ